MSSRKLSSRRFMMLPAHLLLICCALIFGLCGCSKKGGKPANGQEGKSVTGGDDAASTHSQTNEHLPQIGGVQGYIGSESCRECHQDEHASWYRTYHRTMTQLANSSNVVADFNNILLTNETTRFHLTTNGSALKVKLQPVAALAGVPDVPSLETEMSLVTGSHHMQVFWLPEGSGNIQLGFPFTWLIPEKRWVPRGSTFIRPPDAPHRPEVWNIVCSRCHATGVEPHVNMAARTAATKAGELGISCEACHGPAEKHVEFRRSQSLALGSKALGASGGGEFSRIVPVNRPELPAPSPVGRERAGVRVPVQGEVAGDSQSLRTGMSANRDAEDPIVQPRDLTAERSSQVCGFCHSMKWMDQADNWREAGFHYRPGDDLEKTTPIIRPAEADAIPALTAFLKRSPDVLNDFFWPDGMIRVSGREFNGLIESPCYKSKQFSCNSCHSMHQSEPAGLVAEKAKGNGACIQCHDKFASEAELTRHTKHLAGSSGSSCYNCHMPYTTYGVLKGIRSHQISNPKVEDQLKTGRPNACNLCHLDQTLQWTADSLSKWHNQKAPELDQTDGAISSAVRLALEGDAGQRVLIAWHLGWEEALKTSGTTWPPSLLAQLLDDPYAAVRCVTERSLKTYSNLIPTGYDFAIRPENRNPVRDEVWSRLNIAEPLKTNQPRVLFMPADLAKQKELYGEFLNRRNNRPIRLRE